MQRKTSHEILERAALQNGQFTLHNLQTHDYFLVWEPPALFWAETVQQPLAFHTFSDRLQPPACVSLAWRITIVFAVFHSVVVPPSWPAPLARGLVQESQQQQAESRSHPQVSPRQHFHTTGGKRKRTQNKEIALAPVNAKDKNLEDLVEKLSLESYS